MRKIIHIGLLSLLVGSHLFGQQLTVDDMLTLSSLPENKIDRFLNKSGFIFYGVTIMDDDIKASTFLQKEHKKDKDTLLNKRSIYLYKKGDSRYVAYHTFSQSEYLDEQLRLAMADFKYDSTRKIKDSAYGLFRKRNITIETRSVSGDSCPIFTFLLRKREYPNPSTVRNAEDLLKFDSHEYLAGFFGAANVKKDLFYFSDKEIKNCSVLFGNSSRQAVFVWDDQDNLCNLAYVIIGGIVPTLNTSNYNLPFSNNEWMLEEGVYSGMNLRELLMLNKTDFEFYGNQSSHAFRIKPSNKGSINFKKRSILLSCLNCNGAELITQPVISANDAIENNLLMYVYYIIIYP